MIYLCFQYYFYSNTQIPDETVGPTNSPSHIKFHTLPREHTIVLVDTSQKYYDMLRYVSAQSIIAIDAEWKPIASATTEVALIQIATREPIFLIDAILLAIDVADWNKLGTYVFNNHEVLKIGMWPVEFASSIFVLNK